MKEQSSSSLGEASQEHRISTQHDPTMLWQKVSLQEKRDPNEQAKTNTPSWFENCVSPSREEELGACIAVSSFGNYSLERHDRSMFDFRNARLISHRLGWQTFMRAAWIRCSINRYYPPAPPAHIWFRFVKSQSGTTRRGWAGKINFYDLNRRFNVDSGRKFDIRFSRSLKFQPEKPYFSQQRANGIPLRLINPTLS